MNLLSAIDSKVAEPRPVAGSEVADESRLPGRQDAAALAQESDKGGPPDGGKVTNDVVKAVVTRLSDHVQEVHRALKFSVDEVTGQTVITVEDAETGEVIRQIPPQEVLAVMRHLASHSAGSSSPGLLLHQEA